MNIIAFNKIREYRQRTGLRQLDVACKLGFNNTDRISKWEHGIAFPSVINLLKLSKLFGVTPDKLYPDLLNELKSDGPPSM